MTHGETGGDKDVKLTATCVALGVPLAVGGWIFASFALFILAGIANIVRRS